MQRPKLVLPKSSMPWGRWYEDTTSDTSAKIAAQQSDKNSVGSQFSTKADDIAKQMASFSVASIRHQPVPDFSATVTADFSGPYQNKLSPPYVFSSPSTEATSCIVIATYRATASSGEAPNWPIMQVNGVQFTDMAHNNQRPVQVYTQGYYSLQGNIPLVANELVTVQFGVRATPFISSTFVVDQCQLWIAFYGRLS